MPTARPSGGGSLRLGAALACAVALIVSGTGAAAGRDVPKVTSDDIAEANSVVKSATAAVQRTQAQLPAVKSQLASARAALAKERATANAAQEVADEALAASDLAQRRLAGVTAEAEVASAALDGLAADLYMRGNESQLQVALDADDPGDFAERLMLVRIVSRNVDDTVRKWRASQADLAQQSEASAAAASRASSSAATAAAALAVAQAAAEKARSVKEDLDRLLAARARALAAARSKRSEVLAQYEAYKAEQRRIAKIAKLVGKGGPPPSGGLLWPIPGAGISGGVGWRIHPVYGYKSCHTGVDIQGSTGTPIRAAADGTVAEVTNGGPYGLHTVIGHGGNLATMYAHQSRTTVRNGQSVRKGDVIGYVGTTGWVTGPHLHFEVHVRGVPYDPMGWFGNEVRVVPCYGG